MSLAILMGCQTPQSIESDVSIMFDITGFSEPAKMEISTNDILNIFDLEDNPFNYGRLRVSTLTETHLSKIKQAKLRPVESMNSYNKYSRENMINKFSANVDSLLYDIKHIASGKKASSLFIPLSSELHRLAQSSAENKVLICFTDLFENSSTMFSVYSSKGVSKLLQNPAKLTALLSKHAPLPDNLKGVKIYIIYNPDMNTDKTFLVISSWYKELLENNGAEVFIGANLVLD